MWEVNYKQRFFFLSFYERGHNTQHKDIQHNDYEHNSLIRRTKHNGIQHMTINIAT